MLVQVYTVGHFFIIICKGVLIIEMVSLYSLFQIMDMLNFTPDKFEEMPSLHDILTPPSKGDNHAFCDTPLSGEHAVIETDLNGSYTGVSFYCLT